MFKKIFGSSKETPIVTKESHLDAGSKLLHEGRYEEAIRSYDEALRIDPWYMIAHCNKGFALYLLGRYEEAIRSYDDALCIDPSHKQTQTNKQAALAKISEAKSLSVKSKESHFDAGLKLYNEGRYVEAIRSYDEALRIDPRDVTTHYNKGVALKNLGRYVEAIRCYDDALRIDARHVSAHYNKGLALDNLGRYEEAIHCYDEALRIDPRHVNAHCNKGFALHFLGRYEEAIRCYDEALCIDPSHKQTQTNKQAALAKINEAKSLLVKSKESHFDDGVKLYKEGRYEEAICCYDEALRIDPRDVDIHSNKGWALHNLGRYEEAVRCYDEALRINPSDILTPTFKQAALVKISEAKSLLVKRKQSHFDAGLKLHNEGRYEDAIHCYDEALRIDPRDVDIHSNKGFALHFLDRDEEAIRCYDEALRIDPRDVNTHHNKGLSLNYLGRYEGAIRCYDEALRIDPRHVNAHCNKGFALHNLGCYEEAICCFDEALRIDPSHKQTQANKQAALAKISEAKSLLVKSPAVKPAVTSTTDRLPMGGSGASAVALSDELAKLKLQMAGVEERAKRAELAALEETRKRELAEQKAKPTAGTSFSIIPYDRLEFTGRILGEGGFGIVREAKWQYIHVAVKQLKATRLTAGTLEEFKSEAEHHGALRYPNVVNLYGVCLEPTKYCMVMELMTGGSLYEVLHNGKALPWSVRLSIAKDIAVGLNYLHEQKIIHRDLKSMNVMLDDRLRAKLSDFGLSKVKTESSSTTTVKSGGTLSWMAPELFKLGAKCTEVSDLYALGILFWEIASRELPYSSARGNDSLVKEWVKDGEREEIPKDTPPKFASIISQCWAGKIEMRPKSAKGVVDALMLETAGGASAAHDSGYIIFSR